MAEQQQEHPAVRKPPTAAENFAGQLRTLRLDAGQPSFRTMAKTAGSISHTTLYEAAAGARLPSWPTTRAFVRACGGDEAQWHDRWCAAAKGEPPAEPVIPAPPAGSAALPTPPPPPTGPPPPAPPVAARPHRARAWTHALSLLLGVALGALGMLGLLAPREPAPRAAAPDCPTAAPGTDPEAAPPGQDPTPDPHAPGAPPPSWVARPAVAQQASASTDLTLPVLAPVTHGDTLVVSLMLTDACPGPVTVTDGHADRFQLLGDVTDALRHRVLVLAAFGVSALTAADSIRAEYPRAGDYHVAVDEYRGVHTLRAFSAASGNAGSPLFATTAHTPCDPGDLLVATVGSGSGGPAEFGPDWTSPPDLRLPADRLSTAHRIAAGATPCTAAVRTTARWGVVLAVLH
ncbi:hypothetical protein AB0O91_12005 [Kitasatospora sp. NPDC089797]|uniref:hypothetical protein n=1 Tax=Kitasatospora sp. NPDC089797 TaxID=3155298 RepID=UPI00342F3929